MPAKKQEIDCAVECAALKKEVAALKKEVAALKKELKAKSSGGADPRVDKIIEALKMKEDDQLLKKERFAATRKAKLRLSNLKIEELTQVMRGKSKQIKH